jgi:MoaA/NifB/PqqE/SkfB family radical SAM enzyme
MEKLRLLQIDLTDECPLFCSHCSNSSGPARQLTFPFTILNALIAQASILGVETLVFSGGEPLRYPKLRDALACALSEGISVSLFSTGISNMTSRLPISVAEWAYLKSAGLRTAAFSVYSSPQRREIHNAVVRLRPRTGDAFEANESAIIAAHNAGVEVQIHYIPSSGSLGTLQDIHEWAEKLHCSVLHIQMPTLQGRNAGSREVYVDGEQERSLAEEVERLSLSSRTAVHISRFWRYRWGWLSSLEHDMRNQLIIRTDGAVSICNACKYLNGQPPRENILLASRSLADIWSDSAEVARTHNCLEDRCDEEPAKAGGGCSDMRIVPTNVSVS